MVTDGFESKDLPCDELISQVNPATSEYMLLWRLEQVFGKALVERAIQGNAKALDKIEKFAWAGRKHPALVKWVEAKRLATTNQ